MAALETGVEGDSTEGAPPHAVRTIRLRNFGRLMTPFTSTTGGSPGASAQSRTGRPATHRLLRPARAGRWGAVGRALAIAVLSAGCVSAAPGAPLRTGGTGGTTTRLAGLSSCTDVGSDESAIEVGERPVVILVHGNVAGPYRFSALARAIAAHGHDVLCFRWNTRRRIGGASEALAASIDALRRHVPEVTVIGHSLGGLIARRALTDGVLPDPVRQSAPLRLVTIATPFAGVASARTCGLRWARVFSFGTVGAICRRVARTAAWRDFHPAASVIVEPGVLSNEVQLHLHVVTIEQDQCRRRCRTDDGSEGRCRKTDSVFREAEQDPALVADPRLRSTSIEAGHGHVVGNARTVPASTVAILQAQLGWPDPTTPVPVGDPVIEQVACD